MTAKTASSIKEEDYYGDRYGTVKNISSLEDTLQKYQEKFGILPIRLGKENKFQIRDKVLTMADIFKAAYSDTTKSFVSANSVIKSNKKDFYPRLILSLLQEKPVLLEQEVVDFSLKNSSSLKGTKAIKIIKIKIAIKQLLIDLVIKKQEGGYLSRNN